MGGWGKDKEIACQLPSQAKKPGYNKANLLPIKVDLGSEKLRKKKIKTSLSPYSHTAFFLDSASSFIPVSTSPTPSSAKLSMMCPSLADRLSCVCAQCRHGCVQHRAVTGCFLLCFQEAFQQLIGLSVLLTPCHLHSIHAAIGFTYCCQLLLKSSLTKW